MLAKAFSAQRTRSLRRRTRADDNRKRRVKVRYSLLAYILRLFPAWHRLHFLLLHVPASQPHCLHHIHLNYFASHSCVIPLRRRTTKRNTCRLRPGIPCSYLNAAAPSASGEQRARRREASARPSADAASEYSSVNALCTSHGQRGSTIPMSSVTALKNAPEGTAGLIPAWYRSGAEAARAPSTSEG